MGSVYLVVILAVSETTLFALSVSSRLVINRPRHSLGERLQGFAFEGQLSSRGEQPKSNCSFPKNAVHDTYLRQAARVGQCCML